MENISKMIVFILSLFMTFDITGESSKRHILLYVLGVIIYFASWIMIIYFLDCYWSKSILGLFAPAYTPIILLIAVGMLGDFKIYNYISVLFIGIRVINSYIILRR